MATDAAMLYKLMILYMLDKAGFSLTNSQITDFILSRGYTNYFNVQQALSDLEDTGLIETETTRNTTFYRLCQIGRDTLKSFGQRIPETIREDIDSFFSSKKICWIPCWNMGRFQSYSTAIACMISLRRWANR